VKELTMSPQKGLLVSLSISHQACKLSNSLTPFLYYTQTLEGKSCFASFYISSRTRRNRRCFSATPLNSAQVKTTSDHHAIPFENASQTIASSNSFRLSGSRDIPKTTLTAKEKYVFNRISALAGQESKKVPNEVPSEEHENEEHALIPSKNYLNKEEAYDDITALFDGVIAQLNRKKLRKKRPRPMVRAIDLSLDLSDAPRFTGYMAKPGTVFKRPSAEDWDEFKVERRVHQENFMRELERAQTDTTVWSLLETQVFSLIETLQKRNEEEASEKSKKTSSQLPPSKIPSRRGRRPRREEIVPSLAQPSAEAPDPHSHSSASPSASDADAPSPSASPPLSPSAMLSIVQHNYGTYCLSALQMLRREFPASSYAMQILPSIKRLGAVSYVLGATTSLYNELLFIRWTQYNDMHSMADLLEEMRNQGLEMNEATNAVVQAVRRESRDLLGKLSNKPELRVSLPGDSITRAWWKLRGVEEAWCRFTKVYNKARERMVQRRLLEARGEQHMEALRSGEDEEDSADDQDDSEDDEESSGGEAERERETERDEAEGGAGSSASHARN
jgi:hypothetical protein